MQSQTKKRQRLLEIIEDWNCIPEGSVCYLVKENKKSYRVLWCSMNGSYHFTVPKDICKEYKEPKWLKHIK